MRPLVRHILYGLTILALLLALGIGVLWGLSYRYVGDLLYMDWDDRRGPPTRTLFVKAGSFEGVLSLDAAWFVWSDEPKAASTRASYEASYAPLVGPFWGLWRPTTAHREFPWRNMLRFVWLAEDDGRRQATGRIRRLAFPHWAAVVALATPAAVHAVRRRRRAAKSGLCRACGYDLRATPARCPECGRATTVNAIRP